MDGEGIRERRRRTVGRHVGHRLNDRARRAHLECAAQPLERRALAAGAHFDFPARQVHHPAAEAEPAGLFTNEPAKADALHPAADPDVQHVHDCCSQPWVPNRGTKRTGATSEIRTSPPRFSTSLSTCSSLPPTGTIMRPPSASCSMRGCGIVGPPALTRMASYGE